MDGDVYPCKLLDIFLQGLLFIEYTYPLDTRHFYVISPVHLLIQLCLHIGILPSSPFIHILGSDTLKMQPMVLYFYPGMKRRCRGEAFQIPKRGACFGSSIPMEMSQVGLQGLLKYLWKLVLPSFLDMAWGGEHSLDAIYILFRERTALPWS